MKKLVLAVMLVLFLVPAAQAGHLSCDGPLSGILNKCVALPDQRQPQMILQASVGAPDAIALPWNWFLGTELTKDIMTDPFDAEFRRWVEDDHGYYIGIKFEWRGTIANFSGKKIKGAWFNF